MFLMPSVPPQSPRRALRPPRSAALALIEACCALAFVKEDVGMLTPPRCPALTMLADQNSEPDTGTPIILLTVLAQRQHAIGQLVTHDAGGRRGNRSNSDRSWGRIAVL